MSGVEDSEEEDFLLGGGELEWDRSARRFTTRRTNRSNPSAHSYVPPVVPHVTATPTIEDFRLLKTVGKGAFGKVSYRNNEHIVAANFSKYNIFINNTNLFIAR